MKEHKSMTQQVKEFHEKFNQTYNGGPRELHHLELQFRMKCHREELQEFEEAVEILNGLLRQGNDTSSMAVLSARQEVFDALLDGIYFYLGTCHRMGFDADAGFSRVNAANMAKKMAAKGEKTKRDWHMEVVKPEGWKPPNLIDLVSDQDWPEDNVNSNVGLITLDGPDCSGKTTLAKAFADSYGAEYIHLTWSPELEKVMDSYRISAINYAIALSKTKLVILDRPWISQVVYSEVHRGGTAWPSLAGHCDRLLKEANALQIVCCSRTVEMGIEAFKNSGKHPKEELYNDVSGTVAAFISVYNGSGDFYPKSSEYLCDIIDDGGVAARNDFLLYDFHDFLDSPHRFAELAYAYHKKIKN